MIFLKTSPNDINLYMSYRLLTALNKLKQTHITTEENTITFLVYNFLAKRNELVKAKLYFSCYR